MSTKLAFRDIPSLSAFIEWVMPICKASYEFTASLPKEDGIIRLNVVPEAEASVAADQFLRKLPSEYRKRTRQPNPLLISGRKIDLKKSVPAEIVQQTIQRMTVLLIGDKARKAVAELDQPSCDTATTADDREAQ